MKTRLSILLLGLVVCLCAFTTLSQCEEQEEPGGRQDPNVPTLVVPPSVLTGPHDSTILLITFDGYGFWAPNSLNLHTNLIDLGYTVTHLYNPAPGEIESILAAETFRQVWLYDNVHYIQISTNDANAIAAWYQANSRDNIIIDARSYGSYYTPESEKALTANYAFTLDSRCGGLWIGTDHSPSWAYNANLVLTAMGYGTVTGEHSFSVSVGTPVPGSELLNNPNVIDLASVHAFVTPGIPPTGVQSDGTNLQVLFYNTAEGNKPLTVFALESNFCKKKPKYPWWNGVLGTLKSTAKKIGLTVAELIARIKGWGLAWEELIGAWQIYKAKEVGEQFSDPETRAHLIDEAYNSPDSGSRFRKKVDEGVALGCDLIGCTATNWNELTFEQKCNKDIWLSICASVGRGFCSGYLLPSFMKKWLK